MTSLLYKFVPEPDVASFLLQGIVKFTPIPELNDPSELTPTLNVDAVRESLAQLRRRGYTDDDLLHLRRQGELLRRLAPSRQAVQVPQTAEEATRLVRSPFFDSTARLERLLASTAYEISSKVGLLCLSRRYDSLPMWAHYAANAAGLAVELKNLEDAFTGDETGILCKPTAVRYGRDVGVTFDPKSHDSMFFVKFEDWEYEQEVRVVLPLSDCRVEFVKTKRLYLFELPRACVARVILGWNMAPAHVDAIRGHVERFNPDTKVVQARFSRGSVALADV